MPRDHRHYDDDDLFDDDDLPEYYPCDDCDGSGQYEDGDVCDRCNGEGVVDA